VEDKKEGTRKNKHRAQLQQQQPAVSRCETWGGGGGLAEKRKQISRHRCHPTTPDVAICCMVYVHAAAGASRADVEWRLN